MNNNDLYKKGLKVIDSCTTPAQLNVAWDYIYAMTRMGGPGLELWDAAWGKDLEIQELLKRKKEEREYELRSLLVKV